MARILIVYYSMYGHVERMAYAVAEGVDSVEGCGAVVKRVHELIPEDVARKSGVKLDQDAPFVTVDELPQYVGIILGSPTRYGNACAQIRNFIDQTGGLWLKGRLEGKAGSVFTSTATQHGGQETTCTSLHSTLLHLGMLVVGVPYSCQGLQNMDEITGGRRTAPVPSRTMMAAASRPPTSSISPASRAVTWHASPANWQRELVFGFQALI
jgi:NAD(P)H dehydrogenase (quinone)